MLPQTTFSDMHGDELLAAADRNLAATLLHFARVSPGAASEFDGRLLLVSMSRAWPGPYHNGALRLDPSVAPDEVLSRARAFFADRCPGYCVWIAAHADTDLEKRALAEGYAQTSATGTPRMVIGHPLDAGRPPEGVVLEEVVDDSGRSDFLEVTVDAYRESYLPREAVEAELATVDAVCAPGVRAVVAREGGRPVAAAMTVASDRLAGIQNVGTIFGERGRGLGELVTRWAVNAGFELGAEAVVLEASEQGEPLYLRMGFEEVSRYRWCLGPPP